MVINSKIKYFSITKLTKNTNPLTKPIKQQNTSTPTHLTLVLPQQSLINIYKLILHIILSIQKSITPSICVIEDFFKLFEGQINNLVICLQVYINSKLPKSFFRSVYYLITISPVSPTTPLTSMNLALLSSSISIFPGT